MLFRLDDVTKTYGPVTALRRLSVVVPPGAVGLLGPNGAGKTTLIRTLLGLIHIDAGSGEVLGMDVRTRPLDIRQAVGFVPEDELAGPARRDDVLAELGPPAFPWYWSAGVLAGLGVLSAWVLSRRVKTLDRLR